MSSIKVAFHSYQLGERGSEVCLYKYAKYNREILGNESIIISTSSRPTPGIEKFKEFEVILYSDIWVNDGKNNSIRKSIEEICEKKSIDAFYAIKGGEDDGIMPKNAKSLSHCIFRADCDGTLEEGVRSFWRVCQLQIKRLSNLRWLRLVFWRRVKNASRWR